LSEVDLLKKLENSNINHIEIIILLVFSCALILNGFLGMFQNRITSRNPDDDTIYWIKNYLKRACEFAEFSSFFLLLGLKAETIIEFSMVLILQLHQSLFKLRNLPFKIA